MGIAPYGSEYETEDDRREHNRPIPYYAFNEEGEQVHDYDYGDDDDEPIEPVAPEPNRYVVAIYELDRHYGGPEEGGWWYNTGELRRVLKIFRNRNKARQYLFRVNHWLDKVTKAGGYSANLSSMAYSGGCYQARIEDETARKEWSDYRPWE